MKHARYLLVAVCAGVLCSQTGVREQTGPQSDGSVLLPTGWRIQPAGRQVPLDTLPMSTALSSDGKFLLVLNAGYKSPSISVLSTSSMQEIARAAVADAWLGLTLAPGGKTLLVFGEGMPFVGRRALLSYLAARDRIPAIHAYRAAAEEGGLASFGARLADGGYEMGLCAARVLRGDKPADVAVRQITRSELVFNLSTARSLGVQIPSAFLARADEVID